MNADHIQNLPPDEFKSFVGLVIAAQREVYGKVNSLTYVQLTKWYETGKLVGNPWSDDDLRHLHVSGIVCQVYQRIRKECA